MRQSHQNLIVETLTVGPFAENCYLLIDDASRKALLIDPGDEAPRIIAAVRERDAEVIEIVNTHAHLDHVGAVAELKRVLGVNFRLHQSEVPVLDGLEISAQMFGLRPPEKPAVDGHVSHGEIIALGELSVECRLTAGHSPGGCCYVLSEQRVVIAGDTLFAGSIGRTDLPGGSHQRLLQSIADQLLSLEDDFVVYCGHGPSTTIGAERRSNPFLSGLS
ncbi:MAG: MBL fold metallo-hydrolase [Deltaproteobacteria bacterium]|nr:MBL fold metallo-hydrolase [Deltaproteobacteria bacterium]